MPRTTVQLFIDEPAQMLREPTVSLFINGRQINGVESCEYDDGSLALEVPVGRFGFLGALPSRWLPPSQPAPAALPSCPVAERPRAAPWPASLRAFG
jgi:hypothetical protein